MAAEMIFDDRLDPSQIIRSQIDRRVRNDGAMPEFVSISFDGDRGSYKVPSSLLGSIKERSFVRRQSDEVKMQA